MLLLQMLISCHNRKYSLRPMDVVYRYVYIPYHSFECRHKKEG
jgi:hypothetical protein